MSQAEVQKILERSPGASTDQICMVSTVTRRSVVAALKKMLKYREVEKLEGNKLGEDYWTLRR